MKEFVIFLNKYFGIDTALFLSGLFGGLAFLAKPSEMTKMQKALTVIAGVGSAGYLTPGFLWLFNIPKDLGYMIAFILGYLGLKGIELIINKVIKRKTTES